MDGKGQVHQAFSIAIEGLREEWFELEDDSWYQYVMNLSVQHSVTYLLIVLEGQVYNGGFHQYFTNQYGIFAAATVAALKHVGAFKKMAIVERAFAIVNADKDPEDVFMQKMLSGDLAIFHNDTSVSILDKLDAEYYSHEEENLMELLPGFYQSIGVVFKAFSMPELDNRLSFLTNNLVVSFEARLRDKDMGDISVRQENHYLNEGVQYIVEVIDLMYQDNLEGYTTEDHGPTLTVSLDKADQNWHLEFLIIRSSGEILQEKIIAFELADELPAESIEILYKEMEGLLMDILVTRYRK